MDLFFYDFEFHLLHIERKFISANWTVKYNGVGTFEAVFAVTSPVVPLLMEKKYVVVRQGRYAAIVTGKMLDQQFTVYGRTPNWILSKRTVPKFPKQTEDVTTLVQWCAAGFANTAASCTDNMKKCGFYDLFANGTFVFNSDIGNTEKIDFWRDTPNLLEKVVSECLARIGAGHEVLFDVEQKKWVLYLHQGTELPLIISESNKNAYDSKMNVDCLDYYTCGWYEKQSTSEESGSTGSAAENEWVFLKGDETKTGIYRWECTLTGTSESEAKSDLEAKKWNSEIQIMAHGLEHGADYELGDIVRCQVSKGSYKTTVQKRITGVTLKYEQGGISQQPELSDLEDLEKLKEEEDGDSL